MSQCDPNCEDRRLKCKLMACEEASKRFDEVDEDIDRFRLDEELKELRKKHLKMRTADCR